MLLLPRLQGGAGRGGSRSMSQRTIGTAALHRPTPRRPCVGRSPRHDTRSWCMHPVAGCGATGWAMCRAVGPSERFARQSAPSVAITTARRVAPLGTPRLFPPPLYHHPKHGAHDFAVTVRPDLLLRVLRPFSSLPLLFACTPPTPAAMSGRVWYQHPAQCWALGSVAEAQGTTVLVRDADTAEMVSHVVGGCVRCAAAVG